MSKKICPKYHIYLLDADGNCLKDELLPCDIADEKFMFYIQALYELHSNTVFSVCIGSANHIKFEFRDVRRVVNSRELFPNL